ncbi:carboxypeptidase regulatory-like domain-containing protein [Dactylosporangium sp. NPDC005555]|uniref:carboxypeptidase regulatory-like domain-containing protein n=1 Tax=Dactylosporangium sp. NPDC005555 TaxID=3154889 RepID=UPI00339EE656
MHNHALRRPLLYAALTATIIATSTAITAAPAIASGTSSITGHLTDPAGVPTAGAGVWATSLDALNQPVFTQTDGAGAYSFGSLDAGRYILSFRAAGSSFEQYAHQKLRFNDADPVSVAAGATAVVDEQLLATGRVAGTLRNADGSAAQAYVQAYTAEGQNYVGSTGVAPDGTFGLDLPSGAYKIQFYVRSSFYQWNGGKLTFDSAAPIQVTAGSTIPLTETVVQTGSIAGRLTNADGTPASGVGVAAERAEYDGIPTRSATTDIDGRYRMDDAVPGDWLVSFSGPRWISQYAHGTLDRDAAARIAVTSGQVSTVDEQFLPQGTVRIVAHDATSGAPLSHFCAYANANTNLSGCTDGTEIILADVPAVAWSFAVNINDHQHFEERDATVTVTGGQTTTIDVALRRGATLTVPMVKRADGTTAEGCAQAAKVGVQYPYFGGHPDYITSYACSDWFEPQIPGTVVLGPLDAGTYQLFADPRDDALGSQWVGATGGTGDRGAAAQVTLAEGDQVTVPVVRLDRAGTIRGKVTDLATGAPVAGVCVSVTARAPGFSGDGCPVATAGDGTYVMPGVGPYAWPVQFSSHDYQWRWSGNAVSRPEATPVTVRAGKNVTANAKMRTGGGTITGAFRDPAGHLLDGGVSAYNAVTGEAVSIGGQSYADTPYVLANLAPQQQVKLQWSTVDGHRGWVGGTSFASATPFQIKNNKTLTVNVTVS